MQFRNDLERHISIEAINQCILTLRDTPVDLGTGQLTGLMIAIDALKALAAQYRLPSLN